MDVEVVADQLRAHASRLLTISESGEDAVAAGRYVQTNGDAYGVLCSFIGASLVPAQDGGIAAATTTVSSLATLAETLRVVADTFETTDRVVSDAFDYLRG